MALLEKEEKAPIQVPQELSDKADKIFTYQFLKNVYEGLVKKEKPAVIDALIQDPKITMKVGEGFEINDHGMVIPSDRAYPTYNAIAMHERTLLKKTDPKYVRIEDLINCIKHDGFDLEKVKQVFGEGTLKELVSLNKQRQFQFRANVAYKTELMQKYFPGMDVSEEDEEPKPKKGKKAKAEAEKVIIPERV